MASKEELEKMDPVSRQIAEIEEELGRTKYNKATQGHIGRLKAKLASLREQKSSQGRKSAGLGYGIRKEGDATLVLIGFPSVGKSTLLNQISNAESKVGHYDFTTLTVVPGMLELNGAKLQVLDIPGLIEGVSEGKGRGSEVLSVARVADLVVFIMEAGKPGQLEKLRRELHEAGFRLDQRRPDVRITKKSGGGLDIGSAVKLTHLTTEMIGDAMREFKILNAEVVIREDITMDQLIDCILGNRTYAPSLVCVNKADRVSEARLRELRKKFGECVFISATEGTGIRELREAIWRRIGLMRVFMKRIGREPDMEEPLIIRKGATIKEVAEKVHRKWGNAKFARVWGSSKFPGQRLGLDYCLHDRDVVELHVE